MTERDLIDALSQGFSRAPEQVNDLHQSDAEILRLGDDLWAITVDDFSAREDLFEAAEPWLVGWNVVVATLSDLFSVGAVPRFFLPAVCLPLGVSQAFISELSRGTREALTAADCFLIGGDVGQAEPWRYVGTALGPIPSRRFLTRKLPPGSHSLWVSGPLGGANVAAALGEAPPRFPLRREVAAMIREHAAACIDTSGGFLDAVWSLLQATSGGRMEVDVAALPMVPEVQAFAAQTGMPREAALLGGAGEYELLFAVPEPGPEEVPNRLEARDCVRIGRVEVTNAPGGLFLHRSDGNTTRVSRPPPCPRAAGSVEAHIREVMAMARTLFGGGEMRAKHPLNGRGGRNAPGTEDIPDGDDRAFLFRPLSVGPLTLPNRLIRSATYEGMADPEGIPREEVLTRLYAALAKGGVGAIITGFTSVSQEGRAMQRGQCGLDTDKKGRAWSRVLGAVRDSSPRIPILAQLAHAGRQTREEVTGQPVVGASSRSCTYFRQRVNALDDAGVRRIIRSFVTASLRARDAGFDGVQVHGAHGYLIHQFLSPWTNRQKDRWGDRDRLCLEVVEGIREACGPEFGVWVKLSGQEERKPGIRKEDTVRTARRLQGAGVDLLEISYGTMELALNIIRGECPLEEILRVNPSSRECRDRYIPLWKVFARPKFLWRLQGFNPLYNLPAAAAVKAAVDIPVAVVGGVRTVAQALRCLTDEGLDAVGLCRPLIRERTSNMWRRGQATESACTNCNLCTVYCDSGEITRCRAGAEPFHEGRST